MVKVGKISDTTYERLKRYGEFGETFDDLVKKVLDLLEEKNKIGEGRTKKNK